VDLPGIGSTRVDVPRPTTVAPGGCQVAIPANESIAERVTALRNLGLFADRAGATDEQLAGEFEREIADEWGSEPPDDPIYAELLVAERDVDRAWWGDLEADVIQENEVYVATVDEWAAISVGAFTPTSITETWRTPEGPVDISFELAGNSHTVTAEYLDDWIDPRIATAINALIAASRRQFLFFQSFDQSAFVMVLTDDERTAFETRGWCFE
jgi:hypothetical protein